MEKIVEYVKKNWFYIVLTIFFTLLVLCEYGTNIHIKKLENFKFLIYFLIVLACILIHIFIYKAYKNKWRIEKIFLMIAIPLGFCYMALIPVGRVPDERHHYFRAYDISTGNIFAKKLSKKDAGSILPNNIGKVINGSNKYSDQVKNINVKESKKKEKTVFSNTAIYAPIVYAPQAIGIFIGNIFHAPIIIKALLGRLFNFILFLVMMFYSLKLLPFKKHSALLVLMFPILIQQSVSLSADVFANSVSILFTAYLLNIIYGNKKQVDKKELLTKKQKIILLSFVVLISLSKFVYLPICLLLLLIPNKMFKDKKDKYKYILIALLVAFIVTVISVVPFLGLTQNYNPTVDFASQIKYVLSHPFDYIMIFIRTLILNGGTYVNGMTISLGAFDVDIPFIYGYLILFISIVMFLSESYEFNKKDMIVFGLIVLITFGLVLSVEYASWTPVKNGIIDGMQGRYLFPVIIPLILLFNFKGKIINNGNRNMYMILSMIMINLCILIRLFYTYYY